MSADGFQTTDIHFAAAMLYVFGEESLTKIEITPDGYGRNRDVTLHIDAPSLDCAEYFKEFQAGELALSDLKSYIRTYTWITRTLRDMKKNGTTSWESPSWVMGRGK
jgi:hypothetical protein